MIDEATIKPLLRGWSHVVAFLAVGAIGITVVAAADASSAQRLLLTTYLAGTLAMFGASALYHRFTWSQRTHATLSRIDHTAIFLAIAGAYTPIAAFALAGWHRPAVLGTVWGGSVIGAVLQWAPVAVPRAISTAVYVVVGWAMSLAMPQLFHGLGALGFALLLGGGVAYTAGAVVYGLRRPDPWPRWFAVERWRGRGRRGQPEPGGPADGREHGQGLTGWRGGRGGRRSCGILLGWWGRRGSDERALRLTGYQYQE